MEQILAALRQLGIENYRIDETREETLECFFIKKDLDLKRRADTVDRVVIVYHPFENNGQKMMGSSQVLIHPGMEEQDILEALKQADRAASLVCNPAYALPEGTREEPIPAKGDLPEKVWRKVPG